MSRCILIAACAAAATLAATAHAAGPGLSVSVSPTIVTIDGAGSSQIDVSNPGEQSVVVDVTLGNYDITRTGKVLVDPAEPPNRTARAWISAAPATLRLGPGAHAEVTVTSHPPAHAEPGDHHALVLLATPGGQGGQVSVRTRVGVGVLVRMPGRIERRLAIGGLSVRGGGTTRTFALTIANRGNVNELLEPGRVTLTLWRGARKLTTLVTPGYDLLPASSVTKTLAYHGAVRGPVTVVATVRPLPPALDGPEITQILAPIRATFKRTL